ncbi:hypothetical protein MBLNU230_g6992t1 [Neophaeotheca triangularis]
MTSGDDLSDDAVIALLARDGLNSNRRPLSGSNGSLLERRPGGPERKPNTSFLRKIVQSTDRHNAALKAKELEDSQLKLRELQREERDAKRPRRERDGDQEKDDRKAQRRAEERPGRWAGVFKGLGEKPGIRRKPKDHLNEEDVEPREKRKRGRDRSSSRDRDNKGRDHRRRSRSPDRSRSRSPRHKRERRSKEGLSKHHSSSSSKRHHKNQNDTPTSRSPPRHRTRHRTHHSPKPTPQPSLPQDHPESDDPLAEFLGPAPPPASSQKIIPRGRGANKPRPDRFDPNYNPATDPQDSDPAATTPARGENGDWDLALEAAKDRKRWREKGAERLRAAGFKEDEVRKWEGRMEEEGYGGFGGGGGGGDGSKIAEDVRWGRKGTGREWDRGKVVDGEGETGFEAVAWKKGGALGEE